MIAPNVVDLLADSAHYGGPWDGARAIVLHHTAGTDSRAWLTHTSRPPVSVHRLITKAGLIYRIVPDGVNAYHVGGSNLGRWTTAAGDLGSANEICLGIELENLGTGRDPYPEPQLSACAWQVASWWRLYGDLTVVPHRLIDSTGKTDPAGLDTRDILRRALQWLGAL